MISLSCTAENQWFCWWFRTTKPWFFLLMAMPTHESGEASFSTFFHSPKKPFFNGMLIPQLISANIFGIGASTTRQVGFNQNNMSSSPKMGGAFQVWNATIASANFNGSVSGPAPRVPSGVLFLAAHCWLPWEASPILDESISYCWWKIHVVLYHPHYISMKQLVLHPIIYTSIISSDIA